MVGQQFVGAGIFLGLLAFVFVVVLGQVDLHELVNAAGVFGEISAALATG